MTLRRVLVAGTVAAVLVTLLTLRVFSQATAFDLVIRNGKIVDGSGNPWFYGDVAIKNGRIIDIGRVAATTTREIDARGLVVTPGFIEMHGHSGIPLLVSGRAESTIRQGITTVSEGEGASPAPAIGFARKDLETSLKSYGLTLDWTTLGEYFERLQRQGISTNFYSFVSQGTIREAVYGVVNRPPSMAEMSEMKALTERAMKDGAFGLSSSMSHPPGIWASREEYVELAKIVARYGGIYARHLEDESDSLVEAIKKVIDVSEGAGVPAEIFHLKVAGPRNWGKLAEEAIRVIEDARARGLEIWADQYPYERSGWPLANSIPSWAREGGDEEMVKRLKDYATRRRIRADIEKGFVNSGIGMTKDGLENIYISTLASAANQKNIGKSVAQIARERDIEPIEIFFDLLVEENGRVGATYWWMDDQDIQRIMKQPWVAFCTDGAAIAPTGPLSRGKPHPRYYGTFPRILGRYVRELKVITLEDAIRKATSLPAQRLGIRDRGLLREGMWADVTIFNPDTVVDRATYDSPHQFPTGIEYVLVNGVVVVDRGTHTGLMPGKVLRKSQPILPN